METTLTIIGSIVLGISLAASCGLRAFLPLLVVGVLGRFTDLVDIGESFGWLTSAPALLALFVGVVCEVAGDKVPVFNHLLDLLQTPVRTLAGMLVFASVIVQLPAWVVALLAIIIGGGTALAVHTAKSATRIGTTASTGGLATPFVSLLEDVVCFFTAFLSIVLWVFALAVAVVSLFLLYVSVDAFRKRRRRA